MLLINRLLLTILFTLVLSGGASAFQKFELKNCVNINWGKKNIFNYYYNQNLNKLTMETMNDNKIIIKTDEIDVKRYEWGNDKSFIVLAKNDDFTFWVLQKEKMIIKTKNDDLSLLKEKCK